MAEAAATMSQAVRDVATGNAAATGARLRLTDQDASQVGIGGGSTALQLIAACSGDTVGSAF